MIIGDSRNPEKAGLSPTLLAAFDVIGAIILWTLLRSPEPELEVNPAS